MAAQIGAQASGNNGVFIFREVVLERGVAAERDRARVQEILLKMDLALNGSSERNGEIFEHIVKLVGIGCVARVATAGGRGG